MMAVMPPKCSGAMFGATMRRMMKPLCHWLDLFHLTFLEVRFGVWLGVRLRRYG